MRLIVGLGNPESRYRGTRHNIGAAAVRECAGEHAVPLKKGLFSSSLCARVRIESQESLFAVPLSYMNLSGPPVAALARKHRIAAEDILVVHDDLDLEFGKMKLRLGGSAGGHNGLKSVIGSLGSPEFCRLRIGIGRPPRGMDPGLRAVAVRPSGAGTARGNNRVGVLRDGALGGRRHFKNNEYVQQVRLQ